MFKTFTVSVMTLGAAIANFGVDSAEPFTRPDALRCVAPFPGEHIVYSSLTSGLVITLEDVSEEAGGAPDDSYVPLLARYTASTMIERVVDRPELQPYAPVMIGAFQVRVNQDVYDADPGPLDDAGQPTWIVDVPYQGAIAANSTVSYTAWDEFGRHLGELSVVGLTYY